jgi:hypothetical protein
MDKPIPQLAPGMEHLSLFEHHSKFISAIIPVGVTPEDIMHPEFWSHHAKFLLPNDEIRARALDGTWTAYLIVRDSTGRRRRSTSVSSSTSKRRSRFPTKKSWRSSTPTTSYTEAL